MDLVPSPAAMSRLRSRTKYRIKRLGRRGLRRLLAAFASAAPRPNDLDGADRRVLILLMSAWGMGGTIRAAHNVAGHLAARGFEVELASVFRLRGEPFFLGGFPEGVKVTALDDHRPEGTPALMRPVRSLLRRFSSVLFTRARTSVRTSGLEKRSS